MQNKEFLSFFLSSTRQILKQIKKLNNGSSLGPNEGYVSCYKYGGQFILDTLTDICSQMMDEIDSPGMSREAWIAPVWRGPNKILAVNYRPNATTQQFLKYFEGVNNIFLLNVT